VDGDPKIDYRDYLDPRYTPALRQVGELRRDVDALRARVRELEVPYDAAYGQGIEEAFRVVCEGARCIARVRDGAGDWIETIGRRETYLAIRALATRGAT